LAALVLFFSGCTNWTTDVNNSGPKILPIDAAGLTQFIDRQRGKIVLVDFWATWCTPCVQLFPHTVEIHKRWANRGLLVAAVSLDDPSDEPIVRRFLGEKGADFANFISLFGASSQSAEDFDIQGGAIPYLRIYDRQGKPLKTFGGDRPVNPKEIDRAVEEALRS
jgi:thiol-disulfide isomerase/thioredoxin